MHELLLDARERSVRRQVPGGEEPSVVVQKELARRRVHAYPEHQECVVVWAAIEEEFLREPHHQGPEDLRREGFRRAARRLQEVLVKDLERRARQVRSGELLRARYQQALDSMFGLDAVTELVGRHVRGRTRMASREA